MITYIYYGCMCCGQSTPVELDYDPKFELNFCSHICLIEWIARQIVMDYLEEVEHDSDV